MLLQRLTALSAFFLVALTSVHAQQGSSVGRLPSQPVRHNSAVPDEPVSLQPAASTDMQSGPPPPAKTAGSTTTSPAPAQSPGEAAKTKINENLEVLAKVLADYQKSGNRTGEAGTLCAIGKSYSILHQQQKAIGQFQRALSIYREISDTRGQANTLTQIGDAYRVWGFPQQSLRFYRDALAAYSRAASDADKVITLNNLGVAYLSLRDKKKCLSYFKQALAAYHAIDDQRGEALALNNLGMAYSTLTKDAQKAVASFQEALTRLQLADDHNAEATVLDNMGAVCLNHHRKDIAASSFDRALQLFRETGDAQGQTRVLKHIQILHETGTIASIQPQTSEP
jgi:tetratricopeptide (TPR) repeat protein